MVALIEFIALQGLISILYTFQENLKISEIKLIFSTWKFGKPTEDLFLKLNEWLLFLSLTSILVEE